MSNDAPQGWAGFASQSLKALGSLAPWVIITVLAAVAIWKFQELNQENFENLQEIAERQRASVRDDFSAANTALRETYEHVALLLQTHLDALVESVEVNSEMNSRIRTQMEELSQSQIEAQIAVSELEALQETLDSERQLAQEALSQAQTDLDAAIQARSDAVIEISSLNRERIELEQELVGISNRISEVETNFSRVDDILKDLMMDLDNTHREQIAELQELVGSVTDALSETRGALADSVSLGPIISGFEVDQDDLVYGAPLLDEPRIQDAILEIDRIDGTEQFRFESQTYAGTLTLQDIFMELGLNLEVQWSSIIPHEAMGEDGQFTIEELNIARNQYRDRFDESVWHFYLIAGGEFTSQGVASIMFDTENRHGSAIFDNAIYGDFGAPVLWTVLNTLGLQMNLPPPFNAYGDTRSVMTYFDRWPNWDWEDPAVFYYDEFGVMHLRWAPEQFVRPGGSPFFNYGGTTPWQELRDAVEHGSYDSFSETQER